MAAEVFSFDGFLPETKDETGAEEDAESLLKGKDAESIEA